MDLKFMDRVDAGYRLVQELQDYRNDPDALVLALPRGGVVPGHVISRELGIPLDVIMVKKIGHPSNPEYAIGAVSLQGQVLEEHIDINKAYIDDKTREIRKLLQERYNTYFEGRKPAEINGKKVIVVDDGIATGRTMKAALQLLRNENPKEIVIAVPVGPTRTIRDLDAFVDKMICLGIYSDLYAIGAYYEDFSQVSDDEVKLLLQDANRTFPEHI